DLAERHAGLHHAERARIHSQQHYAFRRLSVPRNVLLVRRPRIAMRIVYVSNRLRELEAGQLRGHRLCSIKERADAVDLRARTLGGVWHLSIRSCSAPKAPPCLLLRCNGDVYLELWARIVMQLGIEALSLVLVNDVVDHFDVVVIDLMAHLLRSGVGR